MVELVCPVCEVSETPLAPDAASFGASFVACALRRPALQPLPVANLLHLSWSSQIDFPHRWSTRSPPRSTRSLYSSRGDHVHGCGCGSCCAFDRGVAMAHPRRFLARPAPHLPKRHRYRRLASNLSAAPAPLALDGRHRTRAWRGRCTNTLPSQIVAGPSIASIPWSSARTLLGRVCRAWVNNGSNRQE